MGPGAQALSDRPGGPEPPYAEHPGYGIWPCDNPWHTARRPDNDLPLRCPDCPNSWWAWDGTECPDYYALLAEIRWLREQLTQRETTKSAFGPYNDPSCPPDTAAGGYGTAKPHDDDAWRDPDTGVEMRDRV